MHSRRFRSLLASSLVLAGLFAARASLAAAVEPFSEDRFRALQEQGALVLIDVHAEWCKTCAEQREILDGYRRQNPGSPIHVLRVDFDGQKDAVQRFRAPRQSTLVLFRGSEQIWFSVAETDPEVIARALDEATRRR